MGKNMHRKRYMITFINVINEKVYSTTFGRIRGFITLISAVSFVLIISHLSSHFIYELRTQHLTNQLKRENVLLRQKFTIWKNRTKNIETTLLNLQKRNNEIRIAATLPSDPIAYGIGGPEPTLGMGMVKLPEVQKTELSLSKIEFEVEYLKKNMNSLEKLTETHNKQIAHYPSIRPVREGWISSYFGERIDPFTGQIEKHHAIDISVKPGTEVFASAAGTVEVINTKVIKNKGYGKYIIINHGYGYKTVYAHLSSIYVSKGQKIKRWKLIGASGNTGKSTAPHIHYEVLADGIPQNPMHFILE